MFAVYSLKFALEPPGLDDPHEQAPEVLTMDDVGAAARGPAEHPIMLAVEQAVDDQMRHPAQ
jgi:hypothetical protein